MFAIAQLITVHLDILPWLILVLSFQDHEYDNDLSSWRWEIIIWLLWTTIGNLMSYCQRIEWKAGTGIFGTGNWRYKTKSWKWQVYTGNWRYGINQYSRKQRWNWRVLESDGTVMQAGIGRYWKVPVLHLVIVYGTFIVYLQNKINAYSWLHRLDQLQTLPQCPYHITSVTTNLWCLSHCTTWCSSFSALRTCAFLSQLLRWTGVKPIKLSIL